MFGDLLPEQLARIKIDKQLTEDGWDIVNRVFIEQKKSLITIGMVAIVYIFVSAIVIFNVEPDSFETFFDSIYWATVSLTTMGYGDIYPVSVAGRVITMISAIFGIGIIALYSGIITAGFLKETNKKDKMTEEDKKQVEEGEQI